MKEKHNKLLLDIAIVLSLLIYIVLTTLIFINNKKIKELSKIHDSKINTATSEENEQKNMPLTISHQKNAVDENPENSEAQFQLGLLLMAKKGQEYKALPHLKKVLDIDPNNKNKTAIRQWIKEISSKRKSSLTKMLSSVEKTIQNTTDLNKKQRLKRAAVELKKEIQKY